MRLWFLTFTSLWFALRVSSGANSTLLPDPGVRVFPAHGLVEELHPLTRIVIIRHDAIPGYMDAMTMPFKVKDTNELTGLQRGSVVNFELHVGGEESWIAKIVAAGKVALPPLPAEDTPASAPAYSGPQYELLHYHFTNELGQAVSLGDFPGQALAITFFYTRCPLPDYCPRLSKNFAAASQKLEAMNGAPANWHFLSISFDPEFDSPDVLKAYGQFYQYDPAHWSFLTGPKDKILELARRAGITLQNRDGVINHNFRTLIIDASGRLQTVFPTSGDLSDQIVAEIIKGAAATNAAVAKNR